MSELKRIIDNVTDNESLSVISAMIEAKLQLLRDQEVDKLVEIGRNLISKHNLPNDYFTKVFSSKRKADKVDILAHVYQANLRAQEVRDKKK